VSNLVVAIVPVKELAEAKGRLAPRLSPLERATFALASLDYVLTAASDSGVIAATLVVSPDPEVRARARSAGAEAIDESDRPGVPGELDEDSHNRALELGRSEAIRRWNPSALLVLAGDLPLLGPDDVHALVRRGDESSVVIAPDRRGAGTNALYLRPPDALPFCFGPDSHRRHAEEAAVRGLSVGVFESRGTAHDVDVPCDLEALSQ
jgi:2-phospho-L-lactate guanylyltransferase